MEDFFSFLFMTIVILLPIVGWWRIFTKAGYQGWEILIPFYNIYIFTKIIKRPSRWILYYIGAAPVMFVFFLSFDTWRLMNAFGQNNWAYELFDKKGWIALLLLSPVIIGQNIAHAYIGFPFIAFNKKAIYNPENLN